MKIKNIILNGKLQSIHIYYYSESEKYLILNKFDGFIYKLYEYKRGKIMSLRMSNVTDKYRNYYVLKINKKEKDINKSRTMEKELYNSIIELAKQKGIDRKWSNPEFKKMYTSLLDNIYKKIKKQNKGENGENNIIKYLFINRNNKDIITRIFNIDSCIILIDPKTRKEILSLENINKSSGYYKADIIINFIEENIIYHVSIKCNDGSPPTLLNHTNRSCDYFQNKLQCEQLKILDSVVIKRNNMKKQDVNFNDIKELLTNEEINCLINVISYFTFDGTGSSKSKCPADSIFIVDNSSDILSSYKFIVCKEDIQKKKYIKSILSNLRICMRGGKHGLPGKTNYDKDMFLCKPWLFYDTKNKPCVAIHIRYI